MNDRKDALVAASEFIQRVPSIPVTISENAVATVGKLAVKPNGVNVIPGEVSLYVDMRDIDKKDQESLVEQVKNLANEVAQRHKITVQMEDKIRIAPVPIKDEFQQLLKETLEEHAIRP